MFQLQGWRPDPDLKTAQEVRSAKDIMQMIMGANSTTAATLPVQAQGGHPG